MSLVWESVRVATLSSGYLPTNLSSPEAVAIAGSRHLARFRGAGRHTQKQSSSRSSQHSSSSVTTPPSPSSYHSTPRLPSIHIFRHHFLFFPFYLVSISFNLLYYFPVFPCSSFLVIPILLSLLIILLFYRFLFLIETASEV
jgi:hypothetical protein